MRLVIKLVLYYQSVCFHQSIYSRGDNRCLLLLFSFPKTADASAIFVNSFGLSIIVQKSSGRHSRAWEVPCLNRNEEWAMCLLLLSPTSCHKPISISGLSQYGKPQTSDSFQWRHSKDLKETEDWCTFSMAVSQYSKIHLPRTKNDSQFDPLMIFASSAKQC